jgi:hypothetical protein
MKGSISILFLATLLASASASPRKNTMNRKPAFLQRGISREERDMLLGAADEPTSLNCNSPSSDSDDAEARFALQYPNEQEFLRQAESSYLLRGRQRSLESSVVSVSARSVGRSGLQSSELLFV